MLGALTAAIVMTTTAATSQPGALAAAAPAVVAATPAAAAEAPPGDDATDIEVAALVGTASGGGYLVVGADGRVVPYGDAPFWGSAAGLGLVAPVVAAAMTPGDRGYWLVTADGGVFAFGDAAFWGSAAELPLVAPIVDLVPTATGDGYLLIAADGGVFAYGAARFAGSLGGLALNAPIVDAAPGPGTVGGGTGTGGYTLVAADGGVFAFGGAPFRGSAATLALAAPVMAVAPTRGGGGYHLVASDGGVFAYGDAAFWGSAAGLGVRFTAAAATPDGGGYWLMTADGFLQVYGTAPRLGAPRPGPPRPPVEPTLAPVAAGFAEPVAAVVAPDGQVHVAERAGVVRRGLDPAGPVVLDLRRLTTTSSERGLLGLAYAPDGAHLYVSHTDDGGDLRIAAYDVTAGGSGDVGTPTQVDAASRRDLIVIDQPFGNHNGGDLHFGPDGYLWIASGDGGSAGDPAGNAQRLDVLLGKLLRIDPTPDAAEPYRIPPDNPFVGRPGARPEIWAYGLRNPWRFSFDPATGDLWIGDVGQGRREEVDLLPAGAPGGANLGWNLREGTLAFRGSPPAGHVPPIHEYGHAAGRCSITGGVVVRGESLGDLHGSYVFGDHCTGEIWALRMVDGRTEVRPLDVRVPRLVSFAALDDGEILVLSLSGSISRLTG